MVEKAVMDAPLFIQSLLLLRWPVLEAINYVVWIYFNVVEKGRKKMGVGVGGDLTLAQNSYELPIHPIRIRTHNADMWIQMEVSINNIKQVKRYL